MFKSTAEKLLEGKYTTEEEEIEKIKSLMGWANERAAADTTFSAIRQDIKDEIEEHFENEGKFDYDHNGSIVYEIKGDLKDYVQDTNTWDNIERFNNDCISLRSSTYNYTKGARVLVHCT